MGLYGAPEGAPLQNRKPNGAAEAAFLQNKKPSGAAGVAPFQGKADQKNPDQDKPGKIAS
jgi:hypothetical protein